MIRPILVLIGVVFILVGCQNDTDERIARMEERLNLADSSLTRQEARIAIVYQQGKPTSYQLSDMERDRKNVGWVTSKHSFTKGDRIFLGDDIWDVVYVKAFTSEAFSPVLEKSALQGTTPVRNYYVESIELLVKFGGKATDPKPQP